MPGILAGTQLAGLLFFLNPHLRFTAGSLIRTAIVYGGVLGVAGLAVQLPWTWWDRRRRRAGRLLPWALTVVLGLAAASQWTHASRFAFYLPPGINSRLIKAALLLSVGTLILFYTALLHSLNGRRYGLRSRAGFVLVCVASVLVTAERRAAFQPKDERQRPVALRFRGEEPRARLLVIGVEGMTLNAVLPLAEQGRMPFLASVLRSGATVRLASLTPNRRLPAWTTLAAGKYPYRHQILTTRVFPVPALGPGTELRLLPAGVGFRRWGLLGAQSRLVRREDQQASPLWQTLARLGLRCGVVGWPAPQPIPDEIQLGLSEAFFFGASGESHARPATLEERARLFRLPVRELAPAVLGRFGSDLPETVEKALVQDAWRESLSLFLLEQEPRPQALFVALPGLAAVSREFFGGFETAQLEGGEGADVRRAAELVAEYYSQVDAYLGEMWSRAGDGALLAVVSPAGFSKPPVARRLLGLLAGADAQRGSMVEAPDGALFLLGAGVRPGTRVDDGSIVDLVPTLLYALGYPIARDLEGRALASVLDPAWRSSQPLTFVPSYETLPAPSEE